MIERLTAKAGPLPVYAWALILLAAGYLAYRLLGSSSSSSSTPATPAAAPTDTTGDTGSPPASGQGSAAGNLNDSLFSQLSGFQDSVDALTAAVQMSPAFWPGSDTGSAGSGSTVPNAAPSPALTTKSSASKPAKKPAAAPAAAAHVRYYTYAPGKAPKGQAANAAPGKGPAGTSLRFAKGKGYYYA